MKCKQCGVEQVTGTNFCGKKCRRLWRRAHEARGAKKRASKAHETELMSWGPKFDSDGNRGDH